MTGILAFLKKFFLLFLLIGLGVVIGFIIIFLPPAPPGPDTEAPEQVVNLQVTVWPWGNALNLTWDANNDSDLNHYNIYRSTQPNVSAEPAYLIASPIENNYSDTGLTDGLTYYYKITAVDDDSNEGPPSNEANGIPADSAAPNKVTGVVITVIPAGNALNITWTANSDPDLTEYALYRSISPGFTPDIFNPDVRVTTNYYLDTNLSNLITYYYRISAVDEVPNYGQYSDEASGTPTDSIAPPPVTNIVVDVIPTGNTLNLTWDANPASDLDHYAIYVGTTQGFIPDTFNPNATTTNTDYLDMDLTDGVTYYYRISAVDDDLNYGPAPTEVNGTPQDTIPPPQVTGVVIICIPMGNQLNLTWTESMAADLVNYKIYRSTIPGFTPGPANLIATPAVNYYLDSGLTDGIVYYYRISAVDEVPYEGLVSNEKSGIPMDSTPPEKMTGVVVNDLGVGDSLNITWTPSTAIDLVNYNIYRSTTPGFLPNATTLIATPITNFYLDSGLLGGQTYYYRISAVDEVPNEGIVSDEASGVPI